MCFFSLGFDGLGARMGETRLKRHELHKKAKLWVWERKCFVSMLFVSVMLLL